MPYRRRRYARKNKKVYRKARTTYRRRRYSRPNKALPIAFPNHYLCKVNYVQEVAINASAVPAVYVFRANSCYDPDLTGVGHQPMGFDELSALYSNFVVVGSRLRMTPINTEDPVNAAYWGVQLTNSGDQIANMTVSQIMEQERHGFGAPRYTRNAGTDTNRRDTKVAKFSLKKYFRITKASIRDDQYAFTPASNPAKGAFYECWCAPVISSDPGNMHFLIQIQYIVLSYNPIFMDQS